MRLPDPMPAELTISQVAERWRVKYNTPADASYVLGCYESGLQFCTWDVPTATHVNYSRKELIERVGKEEGAIGLLNFVEELPRYEKIMLRVRKSDLLAFEAGTTPHAENILLKGFTISEPFFQAWHVHEALAKLQHPDDELRQLHTAEIYRTALQNEVKSGAIILYDDNSKLPTKRDYVGYTDLMTADDLIHFAAKASIVLKKRIAGINPPDQAAPQTVTAQEGEPLQEAEWKRQAKAKADVIYKRDRNSACDPSNKDIAEAIRKEFVGEQVLSEKKKVLTAHYILRHGLKGWKRPEIEQVEPAK